MEIGLHNIPRFDESVLPYLVQNFETIERAFRQMPSTRVYQARYTPGASWPMSTSLTYLPDTFVGFDVRVGQAQCYMTAVYDFECVSASGGAVGQPVVDNASPGVAGMGQAIYWPSTTGRATIAQTWAFTLPYGYHTVGLAAYTTHTPAAYNLYGGHTGQTLFVQENV